MSGDRPVVTLISALTAEESGGARTTYSEPPLGVLSLAAVLKARGLHTDIIDLTSLWTRSRCPPEQLFKETVAALRAAKPQILGLSTICSTYPLTLRLAKTLSQKFPDIPIVLGGPQASVVDTATLNAFPFVDFVLRGEAEDTMPTLVDCLLNGSSPRRLPGLTFRNGAGVQRNPDAVPIQDLDSLPLPSFEAYSDVSQWPSLPLEIGRGCPFSCRFCSTSGFFRRRYRLKSTSHVIREMTLLSDRYGIRAFDLIHDMFTVDRRRVAEFCSRLIALGAPYNWSCSARTDCVDSQLLTMMRDAGCSGIFFGIETGSARLQRVIQKNLDLDRARAVFRQCDRLGLETIASLIIGYPDETESDFQATLSFFRDTVRLERTDAQLCILAPRAGTSLEAEYRSRLVFEEASLDLPALSVGQGAADSAVIRAHPDVFPDFYAFPCRRTRSELRRMSEFFVTLNQRCRGLLLALMEECANPMELFDSWVRQSRRGQRPAEWYRRLGFVKAFIAYVGVFYVGRGSTAVDVMWRFYAALISAVSNSERQPAGAGAGDCGRVTDTLVRLSRDVRIVSVRGDVVKVLECLKRNRKPGLACGDRMTTVSVRRTKYGRSKIERLAPLAVAILDCLDGSVDEIIRKLAASGLEWGGRGPAQFVPDALRILACDGLVSYSASA
jgi:B12 binding protein/radical SAM family protein